MKSMLVGGVVRMGRGGLGELLVGLRGWGSIEEGANGRDIFEHPDYYDILSSLSNGIY